MNKSAAFVADTVMADLGVNSLKQAYQNIAVQAGTDTGIAPASLYKRLMDQEQTSPSGIGGGIALPHLRHHKLDKPYILVASLKKPLVINTVDNQPVDIVCLLLSPAGHVAVHLQKLSRLTRLFKDKNLRKQLRAAKNRDTIQALLLEGRARQKAA